MEAAASGCLHSLHSTLTPFWAAKHGPYSGRLGGGGVAQGLGVRGGDALEGKGPQRRPQKRSDSRLEEGAEAVGGSYCRFQMPLKLALAGRVTVAGHRLDALEGGGGSPPPMHPWGGGTSTCLH